MDEIWFWQRIVSPHMAGLARALERLGKKVTYVAEQGMSPDRLRQGWIPPALSGVKIVYANNRAATLALVRESPENAIHICQGVRANGLIGTAQRALGARNVRSWVVMETVNDAVWYGALKRAEYRRIFRSRRALIDGVLASGHRTASWLIARGVPAESVYPFAYFLSQATTAQDPAPPTARLFRFLFVGQLITRKRVDWLINALVQLKAMPFELWIVGSGPEERRLRKLAAEGQMSGQISWIGTLPSCDIPAVMAQTDCLVLPSAHDGWGAVASEAMMAGTPVVCSDACGVAGAVRASGRGTVFPAHDSAALRSVLAAQLATGPVSDSQRDQLAEWAVCMGAAAGADYLLEILASKESGGGNRPIEPWLRKGGLCAAS